MGPEASEKAEGGTGRQLEDFGLWVEGKECCVGVRRPGSRLGSEHMSDLGWVVT